MDDTPQAIVYDSVHKLIFASALNLNCVDVIPLATPEVTQCIPVSGALSLSFSADGTKVLVGTQVGIVAWIDTNTLQVVKRDVVPQIPNPQFGAGFGYVTATQAFEAANGKIFLFSLAGCCDVGTFNQSVTAVEWDPVAGTSAVRSDSGGGGVVSASLDHSKILVAGGGQVALYDSATDQFTAVPGVQFQDATINPMGSQFAVLGGTPFVKFFNLQMQEVGSTNLGSCCAAGTLPPFAVYSPDGKFLYLTYISQSALPVLLTIDATSFQVLGSASAYSTGGLAGFLGEPQAADSTGLVFEIADHGVAINDATSTHDFTNALPVSGFFAAVPAEGPLNTATLTQFETSFSSLPEIFFGSQQAQVSGEAGSSSTSATAPSSSAPGPVNVMAIEPSGVAAFVPQGFTYGAVPVQYGTLASDPRGGMLADLLGYGYSVDVPSANIQVRLGSYVAGVQSKDSFSGSGYPFPLQHLVIAVPPGAPGVQDITVTSSTGTAVSRKAFHYINGVVDYPSGDSFLYVLYDSRRKQLYLSAGDHIDVFSLSSNSFSSPIAIPSNGGTRLILGLALTPDGSRLLAANQSDQSVAIINPDNPTSGAVAVRVPPSPLSGNPGPFQIATTSKNQAFVTLTVGNSLSGGTTPIYSIDLASLQVTTETLPPGSNLNLNNNYIAASADGNIVVEATSNASNGPLLAWDASTTTWQFHVVEGQFWDNIAISGDGNISAVDSSPDSLSFFFPYLFDRLLNLTAQVSFPDFQAVQEGPSLQFDQSGALLYAVVNGIGLDILDARSGQLRERVLLSEQIQSGPIEVLQTPSKVLAVSPSGDQIFLLTTAGLTVVDLDAVPLGIGSVSPSTGTAGTVVTVRGTGFVNGTSATVNGTAAVVSMADSSTLHITIPPGVGPGSTQFILTNPDGSTFALDAAFLMQ
jgi:IPT/TIG domain-containing protein